MRAAVRKVGAGIARPCIELDSQDLHMMDVLLKLEPGAYITRVCTLSCTAGVHGECQ